jgi:methylated-DNA-protein-cysteine methyltransferase-like protein
MPRRRTEATSRPFFQQVHEVVARIPRGRVVTYGQLALLLGRPNGARTVGWAMQSAPPERHLPCHRVVRASGELAPAHVFGGAGVQRALLAAEGITFLRDGRIDLDKHLWEVAPTAVSHLTA